MENLATKKPFPFLYQLLRALFVAGCAVNIAFTFIPSAKVKIVGFVRVEEKLMSLFEQIRLAFEMGQAGVGILVVVIFAAWVAFALLALSFPKRWVFIAGASFAAFLFLLDIFSPKAQNVEYLLIPQIMSYISGGLMLLGFFVKPPSTKLPTT